MFPLDWSGEADPFLHIICSNTGVWLPSFLEQKALCLKLSSLHRNKRILWAVYWLKGRNIIWFTNCMCTIKSKNYIRNIKKHMQSSLSVWHSLCKMKFPSHCSLQWFQPHREPHAADTPPSEIGNSLSSSTPASRTVLRANFGILLSKHYDAILNRNWKHTILCVEILTLKKKIWLFAWKWSLSCNQCLVLTYFKLHYQTWTFTYKFSTIDSSRQTRAAKHSFTSSPRVSLLEIFYFFLLAVWFIGS